MITQLIKTYYQLTKPGIIYGNALTVVAGFFLASKGIMNGWLLGATLLGVSLVIASACVYNNYIDRNIDRKMARTKKRALAIGSVSPTAALTYATILGVVGFGILALYTNAITVLLGVIALVVYVVFYGIFKRRSVHGTLVGSIAGALPPAAGYTAVIGQFDIGAALLFLILVFWQMPHFYAIALYRERDYKAAGIPVLPLVYGVRATKIAILGYLLAFIVACAALTVCGYTGYSYLIIMLAIGLWWAVAAIKGFYASNNEKWARKLFLSSLIVLLVFCFSIVLDAWLP